MSPALHQAYQQALVTLDILADMLEMERSKGEVTMEVENAFAVALNQRLLRIALRGGGVNGSSNKDN